MGEILWTTGQQHKNKRNSSSLKRERWSPSDDDNVATAWCEYICKSPGLKEFANRFSSKTSTDAFPASHAPTLASVSEIVIPAG